MSVHLSFSRTTHPFTALLLGASLLFSSPFLLTSCGGKKEKQSTTTEENNKEKQPTTAADHVPCDFGDDAKKCEGAADQTCSPLLTETGTECNKDEECEAGALCFEAETSTASTTGQCMSITGACSARCGGDFDCDADKQCDPKSGLCVAPTTLGLRFGEACTPDADECAGECVEASKDEWECEEQCRVGADSGCDQEDIASSNVACAYYAYDLTDIGETQGTGDAGICASLCDCNEECPGEQLCVPNEHDVYLGVCTGGVSIEDSVGTCTDLGVGGSGG